MTHIDESQWHHDAWDDADATDALVIERPRRSTRPFKWVMSLVAIVAVVAVLIAGGVGLWYVRTINPEGAPGAAQSFTVTADDTLEKITARLKKEGLIDNERVFTWYVKRQGGLEITPGYYQIRPKDHAGNVLRVLRTPPEQTFKQVTFPEGYTIAKMGDRIGSKLPTISAVDFVAAATDGSLRSIYSPDGTLSLEGLLFPDTYQVSNGETARQVVARMVKLMERVGTQENIVAGGYAEGLSAYQVLIIASMVEREAKTDRDRPKIARVILNRLFYKNSTGQPEDFPLGVDATLFYGQDQSLPFDQLKAIDTLYNTYLHVGLPPTPIANPGRASIRAVINPAQNPSQGDPLCKGLPADVKCQYLYYVKADEDGNHAFAVTLDQHNANIAKARADGVSL